MTEQTTLKLIEQQVKENDIVLYMKGSPDEPRCGFSAQVVKILAEYEQEFAYVDILENPEIRQNLPIYSEWPTFPQLFIKSELVGGCDIITQMHDAGELKALMDTTAS